METITKEMLKTGFIVRDISCYHDDPTFDVLFVRENGICQYSNEIFGAGDEAFKYAKKLTHEVVDREVWDYYTLSETSDKWRIVSYCVA